MVRCNFQRYLVFFHSAENLVELEPYCDMQFNTHFWSSGDYIWLVLFAYSKHFSSFPDCVFFGINSALMSQALRALNTQVWGRKFGAWDATSSRYAFFSFFHFLHFTKLILLMVRARNMAPTNPPTLYNENGPRKCQTCRLGPRWVILFFSILTNVLQYI